MKEHFCPVEQSVIAYQGKCNWCGEQEALAQTQEPVIKVRCFGEKRVFVTLAPVEEFKDGDSLYKHPPQRTLVGLTDEEIDFHLDKILIAAGSALKHYSMQKTKDDMRQALREAFV